MKTKTRQSAVLVLIAVLVTCFTLSLFGLTAKQVRADGVSATYVQTDAATGAAWEGIYGKQGYVVIGNTAKGYYSDMYDGNDGKTEMVSTTWGYNSKPFTVTDVETKTVSPISRWGIAASAWGSGNTASAYKINKPGTTEILTNARCHNGWGNNAFKDTGVMFTLKNDEEIIATLCVGDWSNAVSETKPITVSVFNTAKKLSSDITNVVQYYGEAIATTVVTAQTSYVSFKLAGAGDYQIVAYYDNQGTDAAPITPMVLGFFFDNELTQVIEHKDTVNYYGSDWESSPYGKSGYIVMDEGATDARNIYSNLFVDNSSDTIPTSHSSEALTTSGWGNNNKNTYLTVAGKVFSDYAPITKLAFCSQNWGTLVNSWATAAYGKSLYKPGSTDNVAARLDNGWKKDVDGTKVDSQSPADMSYIIHKEKTDTIYLTLFVIDMQGKDDILADLRVFRSNKTIPNSTAIDVDSYYGTQLLYKQTITKTQSYVTLQLNGNGDFQIVLSRHKNDDGTYEYQGYGLPMITGLFFDSEDPTTAKINEASLTLDGNIGLNFYTKIPGAFENAKMKFEYSDGTTEYVDKPKAESDGTYKFTAKFAAKDYANKVTATLYNGETAITEAKTYSVKEYCDYVLANKANYEEELVTLCQSLENYGKIAYAYFSSETDVSEEVSLTATKLENYKATKTGTLPSAVKNFALRLESGTDLRIYVTSVNGITAKVGETALASGSDGFGEYFEISDLSATRLSTAFEIVISDGENTATLTVSAYSYVYTALKQYEAKTGTVDKTLALVAEAVYNYGEAAKNYFLA